MKTLPWPGSLPALLIPFTLTVLLALGGLRPALAAEAPKSWSGTWKNNRYKTTGPLTCTVIGEQNGQWITRFAGTGLGKPFNYTALITVKKNWNVTTLQGTTKVDGDTYQWSGSINGPAMVGNFQSGNGNNGEFKLQAGK